MSTLTRLLIVLLAVFSIALSALFVTAAAQWENWREVATSARQAQAAAIAERTSVEAMQIVAAAQKEAERNQALAQRDEALRAVDNVQQQLRDLRVQLAQTENRAAEAAAGRKKLEEIVAVQSNQLTAFEKQNQTLLSENIDLQTRNQQLASRNYELTSELTIREEELRNAREKLAARDQPFAAADPYSPASVAAGFGGADLPENVATLSSAQITPNIRGEVIDVVGNYASVNVGQASGVTPGMTAMVFRGRQYLADMVIDTVRPSEAGGKITTMVGDIRPGDRIQFIAR